MSVHSVQNIQATQSLAVSQAQSAQRQATQTALPQDKVTISAAAQAKQTASSIGANLDNDHDGK